MMKAIMSKWGANYLAYDEPIDLIQKPLKTKNEAINIGDKISAFGIKKRTMFELNDGLYMEYSGIYEETDKLKYAIFHVPEHVPDENGTKYAYAFSCVFVNEILSCFLLFAQSGNGARDIDVQNIKRA